MSLWCSEKLFERADTALVRLPATLFCVFLYRFFFCLVSFFNTIFPFGLLFFILTADRAGHAPGSIYIYIKGKGKALDLHTGQAYDQKKNKTVPPLKQLNFFQLKLVDIMTNNTQYTTNCTNLHPTPTSDPLAKVKLAFCTSS